MASATPDHGYLPGRRASAPFVPYQIVLLDDRGTWVLATCPESLPGSVVSGANLQLVRNTNAVAFAGCVVNQFLVRER